MTTTIVVDPLTRIEGHLRIELDVTGNTVSEARSSGTSFRGIENVMRNRDPRDAPMITQRICGVCPIPHARAASEAFESAAQNAGTPIAVNDQARLIRNIVQATNFLDSHIFHFYVMSLPDFIAGMPTAGAWPAGKPPQPWEGGEKLNAQSFATNAATALQVRRACVAITVMLAGKMPHAMGIVPGGATVTATADIIANLQTQIATVLAFVQGQYAADVGALATAFPEYANLGVTGCSLLCYGGFPDGQGGLLFPQGVLPPGATTPLTFASTQIVESVASSRYTPHAAESPGADDPNDTVPDLALDPTDAYSWVKSARLVDANGVPQPCEVGPLARAVFTGRDPGGRGVWARHQARQTEALLLATSIQSWIDQLVPDTSALPAGNFPTPAFMQAMVASQGGQPLLGQALIEAPRGTLGHWVAIGAAANPTADQPVSVAHYGVVTPTTWNASPRDDAGTPGPIEQSLKGLELADPTSPIEALRVAHSFDPCLQCAVH
ncbi:MAG: nickel-dependent hydrogenase large subunit [Polyangiaceae bacterium]|jgi:hydrogenase large subunit